MRILRYPQVPVTNPASRVNLVPRHTITIYSVAGDVKLWLRCQRHAVERPERQRDFRVVKAPILKQDEAGLRNPDGLRGCSRQY